MFFSTFNFQLLNSLKYIMGNTDWHSPMIINYIYGIQ